MGRYNKAAGMLGISSASAIQISKELAEQTAKRTLKGSLNAGAKEVLEKLAKAKLKLTLKKTTKQYLKDSVIEAAQNAVKFSKDKLTTLAAKAAKYPKTAVVAGLITAQAVSPGSVADALRSLGAKKDCTGLEGDELEECETTNDTIDALLDRVTNPIGTAAELGATASDLVEGALDWTKYLMYFAVIIVFLYALSIFLSIFKSRSQQYYAPPPTR